MFCFKIILVKSIVIIFALIQYNFKSNFLKIIIKLIRTMLDLIRWQIACRKKIKVNYVQIKIFMLFIN